MGEWPCGREMFYLKAGNGEAGAHATDFMYAGKD